MRMTACSPARVGEIQITIGTTLFGICSVLMKVCLDDFNFNPFVLNGMRSLFSATFLACIYKKLKEIFRSDAIGETSDFDILSCCGCRDFIPTAYRPVLEKYIYIFGNGLSGWIDTNRVTPKMLVGVALAILGTYLLCGCGWHCAGGFHLGELFGITGALGWASNLIIQSMAIKREIHVVDLSLSSVFISCMLSLSVGIFTDLSFFKPYGFPMHLSSAAWGLVTIIGIFEGIGYLLQALGFRYAEPTKASVLSGLESMVTLLVSHVLLGEKLLVLEYVGCLVLVIGSLVVIAPDFGSNKKSHEALPTEDPDNIPSLDRYEAAIEMS